MPEPNRPASKLSSRSKQYSSDAPAGLTKKLGMKIGQIVKIKSEDNTADIEWLWPTRGGVSNVRLTRPYVGFRSGMHFMPELGSVVSVGYAKDELVVLSYLMPSDVEQLLNGAVDNKGVPTRLRQMQPGEISLNSSGDAEIYLKDTLELRDSKNNKINLDPTNGVSFSSADLNFSSDGGTLSMGLVRRTDPYTGPYVVTDDGLPIESFNGGIPLAQVTLNVKRKADKHDLTSNSNSPDIAVVTLGNLVDDNGNKVVDQAGAEIVCEIKVAETKNTLTGAVIKQGSKIQIDANGKININGGNMLTPLGEVVQSAVRASLPLQDKAADYTAGTFSTKDSQQRATREGDRVAIPLSSTNLDLNHQGLQDKGSVNQTLLMTWVPLSLSCMGIPILCIPASIPAKLLGEITQGADGVFIGSLDKNVEKQEKSTNNPFL